jgi:uncharacterized membrane protein HdeD (DUF308 family)
MLQLMKRYWWAFGVRGALAVLYGLFLFVSRDLSLYAFVMASGSFVLIESLLLIIITFGRDVEKTRMISIEGILGSVIAAVIILGSGFGSMLMPGVTSVMVPVYIGAWAIVTGAFGLTHAVSLRSQMQGAWAFMLSSLLALLCGVWLIMQKDAGALSLLWLIAAFAVLYGMFQSVMIFKVRSSATKS